VERDQRPGLGLCPVSLIEAASVDRRYLLAWLALALIYPPLGTHFYYAQSQIMVLLMLALMIWSMERNNEALAGIVLGLASMLRAYPLAFGCYFIIRRKWRALVYAAITMLICFMIGVVTDGLDPWQAFLGQIDVHFINQHSSGPANVALVHTVSQLLTLVIGAGSGFVSEVTRLVAAGLANLLVFLFSLKVTMETWRRPDEDWRVFSLWVVTMLLISPVTWVHSMILLILPFAQLTLAAADGRASQRAMWMAVASYLMVSLAYGWHQRMGSHDAGPVSAWIAELSPLSLLAAYVSVYWFATDRELPPGAAAIAA
jgi:Glycosyltransferase family 87